MKIYCTGCRARAGALGAIFLLALQLFSCEYFGGPRTLVLDWPPWSAELPQGLFWDLETWTAEEGLRFRGTWSRGQPLALDFRSAGPGLLMLYPRLPGGQRLRPAGCLVYPQEGSQSLTLEWPTGFVAELYRDLLLAGQPWNSWNWQRLEQRIRDLGGDSPWYLDRELILLKLSSGQLDYYSVRLQETWELAGVAHTIPPGEWFRDYPDSQGRGIPETDWYLPRGLHRFYDYSRELFLDVFIFHGLEYYVYSGSLTDPTREFPGQNRPGL